MSTSPKDVLRLSGLEPLEVGKCECALGTALNCRLWGGREASREMLSSVLNPPHFPAPTHLMLSPPASFAPRLWDLQTFTGLHDNESPAQSHRIQSASLKARL
jgi:hypothetical protein